MSTETKPSVEFDEGAEINEVYEARIAELEAEIKQEREWKETFRSLVEGETPLNERWQQECLRRDQKILSVEKERDAALTEIKVHQNTALEFAYENQTLKLERDKLLLKIKELEMQGNISKTYCIGVVVNDNDTMYWVDSDIFTFSKNRGKKFPTRLGAENELKHWANYTPYKDAIIIELDNNDKV